ncbi:hypothetical protein [Paenibacillus sp. P32E]|uniref:hypothetical protein n=1 Tax=Paenibacillus sp. P32E TaxID=1349434 RepID=UPI00116114F9|nr:hypothetical protein [Paenibacillus sp. P32E]
MDFFPLSLSVVVSQQNEVDKFTKAIYLVNRGFVFPKKAVSDRPGYRAFSASTAKEPRPEENSGPWFFFYEEDCAMIAMGAMEACSRISGSLPAGRYSFK